MSGDRLTWDEPDDLPDELDASETKLVYLYLATTGGATVDELHDTLGKKRLELLSILDLLEGEELVEREGDVYVAVE